MKANMVKTVIFIPHFFFFGLTAIFFLLKFHKKDKKNKAKFIVFITTGVIWIIFGFIDFFYELRNIILSFYKQYHMRDKIKYE